jgi:hypothetical protein
MPAVLALGLSYGALLSAVMGLLVAASLRHDPMIWIHDAPPAMRAQAGPPSDATQRRKRAWGLVMMALLLGVFVLLSMQVVAAEGPRFVPLFVAALVAFECFNLFDALVIDLGLTLIKPGWALVPGIDPRPLDDPRWHLRNFLLGLTMGVPFAAIVAGLALLVARSWVA